MIIKLTIMDQNLTFWGLGKVKNHILTPKAHPCVTLCLLRY